MDAPALATTAAFHELIDLIRDADQHFLEGPRAVGDAVSAVEGYRWLTEVLSVALDCYLWADPERPTMVPIVGPTRKFGGDNRTRSTASRPSIHAGAIGYAAGAATRSTSRSPGTVEADPDRCATARSPAGRESSRF